MTAAVNASDDKQTRYIGAVERAYEDVVEDVEFAISEHNFRLTGGNRIGGAIGERRGEAFPKSQIIHFCNLEYARRFLEAGPEFLLHMPCKIVVYEAEEKVFVEARLLPEQNSPIAALVQEVNQMLKAIVDFATEP